VERALVEIWAQLLRVDQVGINDNFFELGGHSLHGMKLISKVAAQLTVTLSAVTIFQCPTIQKMAARIQDLRAVGEREASNRDFVEGVL
jgi:acyl carrier protein